MLLYMICGKQNGELMPAYWYQGQWADNPKDTTILYISQEEDAKARVRRSSINTKIKHFAGFIRDEIYRPIANVPGGYYTQSKIISDIIQEIISLGINASNIPGFVGADKDIDAIIYKSIQKFVHVKIINLFDGSITYQDIENFMSKDVQRLMA